jgi:hypothetical protein
MTVADTTGSESIRSAKADFASDLLGLWYCARAVSAITDTLVAREVNSSEYRRASVTANVMLDAASSEFERRRVLVNLASQAHFRILRDPNDPTGSAYWDVFMARGGRRYQL